MAKQSVLELYKVYETAASKAAKAKEAYEKLDADAKLLRDQLVASIPPNQSKEGVLHKRFEKKNVSYKNALDEVRDNLVPKTKLAEVLRIIEENTSISFTDKIELEGK